MGQPEAAPPPPVIEEIKEVEDDKEAIIDVPEVDPTFVGGEAAMAEWIQKNIEYPPMAVEMGEQGVVYVEFVVNTDGSIEQVKTKRGVSDALDAEAKRIVKKMPKWNPGEQAGKKVRVRFVLPINFRLA